MINYQSMLFLLVFLGSITLSDAKEVLPKQFKFECVEKETPARLASLRPLKDLYDNPLVHLKKKAGVVFFADIGQGKWGWVGMPVKAVWNNKIYCVTEDNVGFFFEAIKTEQEAYELVAFVPSYWRRSMKTAKKDAKGFVLEVTALGMNRIVKTKLTYRVHFNNTYQVIGNTHPEADPTEGVVF